jgi:hypothetical protein
MFSPALWRPESGAQMSRRLNQSLLLM